MDVQNYFKDHKYRTELHAHTNPVSACGKFSPEDVVATYKQFGVNTLVITNHMTENHLVGRTEAELAEFYLSDYYRAVEAARGSEMNVVLGVEIRFAGPINDYLVYGVCPNDIEKMISYVKKNIQAFYTEFHNDKNVIIHAHPFRKNMEPTPIGYVDGIETFNCHPGHNSKIPYACRLAREHGLLVTGGSDYHEEGRQGTCITLTRNELRNSYDVAEAIRSRDIIFDLFGHIVVPYYCF